MEEGGGTQVLFDVSGEVVLKGVRDSNDGLREVEDPVDELTVLMVLK